MSTFIQSALNKYIKLKIINRNTPNNFEYIPIILLVYLPNIYPVNEINNTNILKIVLAINMLLVIYIIPIPVVKLSTLTEIDNKKILI